MTSLDSYFGSRHNFWGCFQASGKRTLAVSEVYQECNNPTGCKTVHRELRNEELQSWLSETSNQVKETQVNEGRNRCILRVVWVLRDLHKGVNDIGRGILETIVSAFKHDSAYQVLQSAYALITQLHDPVTGARTYIFCNHPKSAMTWSRDAESGVVSAICVAAKLEMDALKSLMGCEVVQDMAACELTPALMCSVLCMESLYGYQEAVKNQVRATEVRTGHHSFRSRVEPPAFGDLLGLSARMSGCALRIGCGNRKLGVIEELNHFILDKIEQINLRNDDERMKAVIERLKTQVDTIKKRTAMQQLDEEFLACRVQTQQDAVSVA